MSEFLKGLFQQDPWVATAGMVLLAFVAREYRQRLPDVRLPQVERARVAANEDVRDAAPNAGSPRDPRSGTPVR